MQNRPSAFYDGPKKVLIRSAIMIFLLLFIVQFIPFGKGAVPGPEVVSGSNLTFDRDGKITSFTVWIEFPEPMDIEAAGSNVRLSVPGVDDWSLNDPAFPYESSWSPDYRTLEIGSGSKDLSNDDIHSLTVTISIPLRTGSGDMLWAESHRSEIALSFGNPSEMDLGFSLFEILAFSLFPFVVLLLVIVGIEMVLRATIKVKDKERTRSTTETLLGLVERSQRMLRRRVIITLLLSFLVISVYIIIVLVAAVNLVFAMAMTWVVIFFLTPWVILFLTSGLFLFFRWEDIAWKRRLDRVREEQRKFLDRSEKE